MINALNAHLHEVDAQPSLSKKGLKLEPPQSYDGGSKLKVFEQWVVRLIRYFKMHGLLGPGEDNNRVYIIGHLCTSHAQDWYHHTVEMCDYGAESWTTLEVIQGLQARFITPQSAADAAKEFRSLTQGTLDAQQLYQELRLLSNQLPVPTDSYTFAQRYMSALHTSISRRVMLNGFSAAYDHANIEVLVRNAVDTEMSIRLAQEVEGQRPSQASTSSSRRDRDRKGKARQSGERRDSPRTSQPASNTDSKRVSADPIRSNRSSDRPTNNSNITCYRCGQKGHIAPNCPTNRTVSGKAVEPILEEPVNNDDEEEEEEPSDIGVAMAYASSESEDDGSGSDEERSQQNVAEYSDSDDSVWAEFNQEHQQVGARVVQVVPIEPEVDALAVSARRKAPEEPEPAFTPVARKRPSPPRDGQPVRTDEMQSPFTGYFRVGTTLAHILFDSGSGTDMISPAFVRVAQLTPLKLEQPIGLQLATIGSRSKVNFGVNAEVHIGPVSTGHYFDVVNIEKYDIIIGTPFMRRFGMKLDFGSNTIDVQGTSIPNRHRTEITDRQYHSRPKGSTRAEPSRSEKPAMAAQTK